MDVKIKPLYKEINMDNVSAGQIFFCAKNFDLRNDTNFLYIKTQEITLHTLKNTHEYNHLKNAVCLNNGQITFIPPETKVVLAREAEITVRWE